ncbi:Dyp-type peroxidase [Glutamicibacter sp. JL.03c]|uniref:Dyp-type peroxidase n=1 Tax=Glutamicibacter sp. JL.03c TaxID=2984842 RepID=UPI0021F7AAC3|nr:Dyp-type peroxidase [Glutamicibacter sp. JL.03c]UYQ77335.1 Dyp-type peroxidase [Glutamicibacter sp. JL.03c]
MARKESDSALRPSRRGILFGGAAAGLGAVATLGVESLAGRGTTAQASEELHGQEVFPFYGQHQAGIATAPQAHAVYLALTLRDGVDREGLMRLLRLLTDDAARLTQGEAALADTEPELGTVPARLTVTFGFGPKLVEMAGSSAADIQPLPKFSIDRLQERWNDGHLLLHLGSDDPFTLAHAQRMLLKDARSFCDVKWVQTGFRRSRGSEASGTTMRNLFGQVDGTVNPAPATDDFTSLVWNEDGSTTMVIRRIHMDVDTWDEVDRSGREFSVGRTLGNGAPTTGTNEHDEPDFGATTALGFPVIADQAHIRRARSENTSERIFRRGYNYDEQPSGTQISDSGLIFVSYQKSVERQYIPLQKRLAELDALNQWTTPIGSAVFLIPPGCAEGGFIGEPLFTR